MHNLDKDEQARRKDYDQPGVAQEALNKFREIEARGGSSTEVFTENGYSLRVLKQALVEEKRVMSLLDQGVLQRDIDTVLDTRKVNARRKALADAAAVAVTEPIE